MPNPFALLDRFDFDFDLPPAPSVLERADSWFNRLSELQRIGAALLVMLFLAASAFYCLGLGSTVLVNRAEAEIAVQQAAIEVSVPTAVPTVEQPAEPTLAPATPVTPPPTPRPGARPTQIVEYPTPIPPQFLPTVPIQPGQQRAAAPSEAARPRIVAPYEPATPTPPVRAAAPAAPAAPRGTGAAGTAAGGTPASSGTGAAGRLVTPTPALSGPAILRTQTPANTGTGTGTRPSGTSVPATRPAQPVTGGTAVPRTTPVPVFQNPLATSAPRTGGGTTPVAKPTTTSH